MQNAIRLTRFIGECQIRYIYDKRSLGPWMRKEMASMGPAFIKMGQFLSTRSDLLDKSVSLELAKLQDDLEPVPFEEVRPLFKDIEGIIDVDPIPIACASIGQVHRARGARGQDLAIKVKKPRADAQIRSDLDILSKLVAFLYSIGSQKATEFDNLLQEFRRFLTSELDYTAEGKHMLAFKQIFDQNGPGASANVKIPRIYTRYSNENILVMEYVPSVKITDNGASNDPKLLARTLVTLFIDMIVRYGLVHCDPHPGNIGVGSNGEIVLYDFGNVVYLSKEFRAELNNLLFAIYQKDVDEFTDLLLRLNILQLSGNSSPQDMPRIRAFFRSFFEYLETVDFEVLRKSIREEGPDGALRASGGPKGLRINADFLALFRVFSLLDGTCSRLDSDFNYIEVLQPYAQESVLNINFLDSRARRDFDKLRGFPKTLDKTNDAIARVDNRIDAMKGTIDERNFLYAGMLVCMSLADEEAMRPFLVVGAFVMLLQSLRKQ